VADGVFADAGGGGEGVDIVVVQAVAQVDAEAGLPGEGDGGEEPCQFDLSGGGRGGVGIGPGMEFDERGADLGRGFDLGRFRVDEEACRDAGAGQFAYEIGQFGLAPDDAEAAFGGEFPAFFRDQADHVRLGGKGDAAHFRGGGHFQVQPGLYGLAQQAHVPVLDVASVLAQVDDDGPGAGQFGQGGGSDGIGLASQPGLAQRGHVVDIDREQRHGGLLLFARRR